MADLGSTPNLTTLSGFGDSRVIPGDEIYVISEDADYVYRLPPPTFIADGVNAIKAVLLVGTWMRRVAGNTLAQAAWFIDPTNGNDANDGSTAGSALQTDAERQRRWGGATTTTLTQPTTVTYLSAPQATDVVNYDVLYLSGASLSIVGTPVTTQANVAITAVTALNRTANPPVPWDITGATLGAGDVGKMVTINAGARAGNYAVVVKDLTGGKVRVSPFGNMSIANTAATFNPFVQVVPAPADVVDVQTMTTLTIGSLIFRAGAPTIFAAGPINCIVCDSVILDGSTGNSNIKVGGSIFLHGANVFYRRTQLMNVRLGGIGGQWMAGGAWSNLVQVQGVHSQNGGPFCLFMAVAGISSTGVFTLHPGASAVFDGDCLWQNGALFVYGWAYIGQFGSFDMAIGADFAIQVFNGGSIRNRVFSVAGPLIYGDNNLGVGMKVFSGGQVTYTAKPTINTNQGAGRMSLIGATNKDWASVPFVEPTNNAMIVLDQ